MKNQKKSKLTFFQIFIFIGSILFAVGIVRPYLSNLSQKQLLIFHKLEGTFIIEEYSPQLITDKVIFKNGNEYLVKTQGDTESISKGDTLTKEQNSLKFKITKPSGRVFFVKYEVSR